MSGKNQVLIDSNIIVYSTNKLDTRYNKAKEFRNKLISGEVKGVIAHQNIFESIRILTHKNFSKPFTIKKAIKQLNAYKEICEVIYPLSITEELTLQLLQKYNLTSNLIFDTYLVATMLSNDISTIATNNVKDFEYFDEIKVINPL